MATVDIPVTIVAAVHLVNILLIGTVLVLYVVHVVTYGHVVTMTDMQWATSVLILITAALVAHL